MTRKLLLSLVVVLGLLALGKRNHAADAIPAGSDDKVAKLFQAKCGSCHGKDGKGNAAMAKSFKLDPVKLSLVTDEVIEKEDKDLIAITTDGKGKMPPYKQKLSEKEIKDLVTYMRSLAPAKGAAKEETKEQGK